MEIEEGVIGLGGITPSEISIILQMIRKPNSIIALLSIQHNPWFKNKLKNAYLHRFKINSSSIACLSESLGDEGLFSSANILQIEDVFAMF